jgi:predicted dinucleotide-binding enzyme
MQVAFIGHGNVGKRLADLLRGAGHDVVLAKRGAEGESVREAEVVFLAIPFAAAHDVVAPLADSLSGKIVVDVTNPVNSDWSPIALGEESSAGERIAQWLPRSSVVKAFNTVFADVMVPERIRRGAEAVTAFIASDDASAATVVASLASDMGFAGCIVGALARARYLEAMAHLNIAIAMQRGAATNAAFIYREGI